jgi:hypothetical protein
MMIFPTFHASWWSVAIVFGVTSPEAVRALGWDSIIGLFMGCLHVYNAVVDVFDIVHILIIWRGFKVDYKFIE